MAAELSINLGTYIADRAAGAVKVVKLNGVTHYTGKRFDPATGQPSPVLVQVDKAAALKTLEQFKSDVAALEQLVADIDAAQEKLA